MNYPTVSAIISDSDRWFHCTTETIGQDILDSGYTVPLKPTYFHNGLYYNHLPLQQGMARMIGWEEPEEPYSDEMYEELVAVWLKKFRKGTILWVSDNEPNTEYGDFCLEVTLPKEAIQICSEEYLGWAFYYPERTIPNWYFEEYVS